MQSRRTFFSRSLAFVAAIPFLSKAVETQQPKLPSSNHKILKSGWKPDLTIKQQQVFDDDSDVVFVYGGKCAGKKTACLNALIRHCFENKNALALIICETIYNSRGGIVFDLEQELSKWKAGYGIDFEPFKIDVKTKYRHLFISNKHGGWSRVVLMSLPYPETVPSRMMSLSPSFVYHHDATDTENDDVYYTHILSQLGRRVGIHGPQQYYASGVPTPDPVGKNHWTYRRLVGQNSKRISTHHFSIEDNAPNVPDDYLERLNSLITTAAQKGRYIDGVWPC